MEQTTIQQYRKKFEKLQETIGFWIDTEPKAWYRQKFKFRLIFRKKDDGVKSRNWSFTRFTDTAHIYDYVKQIDPTARTRHEFGLSVFTNSTALLDAVLTEKDFQDMLIQVTHMDLQYANEFENLDNVAVDVKIVGPRSRNRDYKYMVQFMWNFGRDHAPGAYSQSKYARRKKLIELYNFCMENSDSITPSKELERFGKYSKPEDYFYASPKVWCHNADTIPLMYIMFGEIEKVYKIVKKENNNE